jgi:hypothetical protein
MVGSGSVWNSRCRIKSSEFNRIRASARMGSRESSDGLSWVMVMGLPSNQVAKSSEKVSARNLQVLSNMEGLFRLAKM